MIDRPLQHLHPAHGAADHGEQAFWAGMGLAAVGMFVSTLTDVPVGAMAAKDLATGERAKCERIRDVPDLVSFWAAPRDAGCIYASRSHLRRRACVDRHCELNRTPVAFNS